MKLSNHRSFDGFSKFIALLKSEPNRTLKYYGEKLGCGSRQCQKWLSEIEVTYKIGQNELGRGGCKLWRIKLPADKQKALQNAAHQS